LQDLVVKSYDDRVMYHYSNDHAVWIEAQGVYSVDDDFYLVHVRAGGTLNAAPSVDKQSERNTTDWWLGHDSGNHRCWFTESYRFTARPGHELGHQGRAIILESIPKNIVNTKVVTNGMDLSFNGKFSGELSGKIGEKGGEVGAGVGGEIGGGFAIKSQIQYDVDDLTITDYTHSDTASWKLTNEPLDFRFPHVAFLGLDTVPWLFWWGYGPIPEKARATIQPEFQWIWKLPGGMRENYPKGIPIDVELQSTQRCMHYNLTFGDGVPIPPTIVDIRWRQEKTRDDKTEATMMIDWPLRPGEVR
jgi:hypothetical protein